MLNDWSHKVRAILKKYCPGNIKKILPSSLSAWNTQFYFGHQKPCMDNNIDYFLPRNIDESNMPHSLSSSLSVLHQYPIDLGIKTVRFCNEKYSELIKNAFSIEEIIRK